MLFDEFVRKLPGNTAAPTIVESHEALDATPTEVPGYIPPTFTVHEWPPNASVVLVEAAGAVGKSTSAVSLSRALKWPLIRTEAAQVGSYSLSGLLQDAFGYNADYIPRMVAGETGVIVDSLDEANLRAGTDNFLAFLDNIQRVSGGDQTSGERQPSIVLFSRSDAAELIRLSFLEAELPLAHIALDFFNQSGSEQFIVSYMRERYRATARGEYNIPLASPKPFARMRDQRLSHIASILTRKNVDQLSTVWGSVQDFLGYAPVLVAVAESLAVTNPAAERAKPKSADANRLLNEIVDHIMDREQKKFSQQVWPKLYASLPATEDEDGLQVQTLYTPQEQVTRLVARVTSNPLVTPPPFELPTQVRSKYEEAVNLFLAEHPFLKGKSFASVVFSDYVSAAGVDDDTTLSLARSPYLELGTVGPFFTRFLSEHLGSEDATRTVPCALIQPIISSWSEEASLAGVSESGCFVTIGGSRGSIQCWRESVDDNHAVIDFGLHDLPAENISLRRNLRQTIFVTDRPLILGERAHRLTLGPRVVIVADTISVEAEVLRVMGDPDWTVGTVLSADSIAANYLTKIEGGPDSLVVYSDDPPPHLRPYVGQLVAGNNGISYRHLIDLRSVLMAFKPSTKGLSFLADHMDQRIVRDNVARQRILDHLLSTSAIFRDGAWLLLDLRTLGAFGFGLNDLRAGVPTKAVLEFLSQCGVE